MRVTVAQIAASTDRGANLEVARDAVARAARAGSDLVVLPEYASAFDPRGVGAELAEPLTGPFVAGLQDAARRGGVGVVAGTTLPAQDPPRPAEGAADGGAADGGAAADGRAVNAVVAVGPDGALVGVYRKVHLYDAFGHRESDRLAPGPADAPPLVWEVAGVRVGVLTCYDLRFPESARRLVDAGARVLLVPAAWAAGPLKLDHWRTLARARAIENTAVVVAVGQCGRGVTGHSLVVGPDGVVGVECGDAPELRTVDVDPGELDRARAANPSLANRRYRVVPA